MDLIYADQAATSFPKPDRVVKAIRKALTEFSASPGRSSHRMSIDASRTVFEAREKVADLFNADDSSRICFTQNVTQSLNMAISGLVKPGDHVLTTSMEHNSVMRPLVWLEKSRQVKINIIQASPFGLMDYNDFKKNLTPKTSLVVINHASNVTGAICDPAEVKKAIGRATLLVDAAQSAGAIPIDVSAGGIDILAFTGHKSLLGPTGTGGMWVSPDIDIEPFLRGGTGSNSEELDHPDFMPDQLEAGTLNTHGLAGLLAGIEFVMDRGVDAVKDHEQNLVDKFIEGLAGIKGLTCYSPPKPKDRLAVVSINLAGWSPSDLSLALDSEFGIMTRGGMHCAAGAHKTINTYPMGTVRFSFGIFNTLKQVEKILTALETLDRQAG